MFPLTQPELQNPSQSHPRSVKTWIVRGLEQWLHPFRRNIGKTGDAKKVNERE
jgi:hypothetical protein